MNSRRRFREIMAYGRPDRPPLFEEGIRSDVLRTWNDQGLPVGADIFELFPMDRRVEIAPELLPLPEPDAWPAGQGDLESYRRALDPGDPRRLPRDWPDRARAWSNSDAPLLLRVHRGLYQTLGVSGWQRFAEVNLMLKDDPELVREMLAIQAAFAVQLLERILSDVSIDAAIFSEPISGNSGPLISPAMYEQLIAYSYDPLLQVLRRFGVETIILRTYANARILLPSVVDRGFNCLWACEVDPVDMDYADIRRQFGRDLRLIGNIDVDVLRQDHKAIHRELLQKVPPLLAEGGFIPLADGRVRPIVPYENYATYRTLLAEVVAGYTP